MSDTTKLRALLEKATPGEWKEIKVQGVKNDSAYKAWSWNPSDAALIVALVNAAPELLDELEDLRKIASTHDEEIGDD